MTASDPTLPACEAASSGDHGSCGVQGPPAGQNPPSLQLPWMQALIHSGARLSRADEICDGVSASAKTAVHYVRCGYGPGTVETGTDFLTAVAKARKLVAKGAQRIVFLTFGDTPDGRLHHSLISFSRHAGRALKTHPAEFAVVPLDTAARQTHKP